MHFTIVAGILFAITLAIAFLWQALGTSSPATLAQVAAIRLANRPAVPRDMLIGTVVITCVTAIIVYLFRSSAFSRCRHSRGLTP